MKKFFYFLNLFNPRNKFRHEYAFAPVNRGVICACCCCCC